MLITDKDPILAARAIPLELIEPTVLSIKEGYEKAQMYEHRRIRQVTTLDELVYSDLTYSRKNCEWYQEFYKELLDITKIAGILELPKFQISPLKVKNSQMFLVNPLNIHSPLLDGYYQDLISKNKERYEKILDMYTLSRVMLIDLKPQFEDFVKGTPIWLLSISNVLLEAYDQLHRRHIRIIRDKNKLRYMTSVISDNWEEVTDVPSEMDIIVQYLISNRANLAFTNQ